MSAKMSSVWSIVLSSMYISLLFLAQHSFIANSADTTMPPDYKMSPDYDKMSPDYDKMSPDYDKMQQYKHQLSFPINDFTLKIFQQLVESKTGNILWSPFLVSMSLAFIQMTDRKASAEKFQSLIYPSVSWELFHQSYTEYLKTLQDVPKFQLSNKLYIDPVLLPQINTNLSRYYFLEIDEIHPRTIGKLSEKLHKNKITNFMAFGKTNQEMLAVLVNSLHFQGSWKHQFNRKFTMKENFYVTETQVEPIEMMYTEDYFSMKSDERLSFRSLEIPLVGDRFSFYIILPDDLEGITTIENKLTSRLLWQIIANKSPPRNVALILPKLQTKSNFTFQDILFKEKISSVFDLESNNQTNPDTHLIHELHQGFININEFGITSNPASMSKSSHLREKKAKFDTSFTVNHPFLYFVVDKTSFMILHVGKYTKPESGMVQQPQHNHDEL